MEEFFEREWVRSIFSLSLERLRKNEMRAAWQSDALSACSSSMTSTRQAKSSREEVAQQFSLKTSDVTNYLAYARREFRRVVLEQLREMTGSEEEFRREARTLLGVDAS